MIYLGSMRLTDSRDAGDSYLGLSGTEALPRFVNLLPLWVGISTPPDGAQPLPLDVMERDDGSLRAGAEPEATG